jgi:hypothetical protein
MDTYDGHIQFEMRMQRSISQSGRIEHIQRKIFSFKKQIY